MANSTLAQEPALDGQADQPKFDAGALEFFEKKVRPLLSEQCYECHGPDSKKRKADLRVDSRAALLQGGETGPAIVPGNPKESLLIDAVNYGELYQMPPKSKLAADQIATLTKWVEIGAPWPREKAALLRDSSEGVSLEVRRGDHWCWKPVQPQEPPTVKNTTWPQSPIDRFILAKLEEKNLKPAAPAERRTLIRRVYFDLVGLPPEPHEVEAFLADTSETALAAVVDRLLDSPHFGERWARHWLDLARYAESRGHEGDDTTPNAYQYRDYVIRALNADVPYDQFVTEQIAGDLVRPPRLHPTEGFNESILGTGFWFLGEWVHSPVSIRKDETDRFDNMVDVMSKTFLGVTVACARCHEHKFDPISQEDYYALMGYLQSSNYRQVRFDSLEQNRRIATELDALRKKYRGTLARAVAQAQQPVVDRLSDYLLAAREAILSMPEEKVESTLGDVVVEDFEGGTYLDWEVTGTAFGDGPETQETIAAYQGNVGAVGKFFVNSHRKNDKLTGKLTSPKFTISHDFIRLLIGGGAHKGKTCVNLLVGGKVVLSSTGKNNNKMDLNWWNVSKWKGKQAQIEIVDDYQGGWGNIGADHIVLTNTGPPGAQVREKLTDAAKVHTQEIAAKAQLDGQVLIRWVEFLLHAKDQADDPLHIWAKLATDQQADDPQRIVSVARPVVEKWKSQLAQRESMTDDARVIIDYATADEAGWMPDGFAFGLRPVRLGEVRLGHKAEQPLLGVARWGAAMRDWAFDGLKLAPSTENDSGRTNKWNRWGYGLRTPTFTLETGLVYYLVQGPGKVYAAVDSHRVNRGPLHGRLIKEWKDDGTGRPRWIAHDLQRYQGHRVHIEFVGPETGSMAILQVVEAKNAPAATDRPNMLLLSLFSQPELSLARLATGYQGIFVASSARLESGEMSQTDHPADYAEIADWMAQHAELFRVENSPAQEHLAALSREFVDKQETLIAQIQRTSRTGMAMLDGSGEDEYLLVRGNYRNPAELVPRRFLGVFQDSGTYYKGPGSGRLQLARRIVDPSNPLTSRVMVNRLWHQLFGRGIVASTDNFGVLGQRPTHPELLDYLADRFVADGWSIKRMIRALMLTSTYQMASTPDPRAEQVDPMNLLLHRMRIRRLQGEVIRDAILAVSGRLDRKMYGPSVPVYLTAFMQGRGRPAGGPLDGHGRRSIYISVRRNFLSPMMLAFDTPIPFTTIGRRNVSNVPAQALILMNDPFVVGQMQLWAQRELATPGLTPAERVRSMYMRAFARPPSEQELADAIEFLVLQGSELGLSQEQAITDPRVWTDLCHVLVNVKDFIFVN